MNSVILILVFLIIIGILPAMYFISQWRTKKLNLQEIEEKKKKESEKNVHSARIFGFIMILIGFGSSFAPSVGDIPLSGRIFFIVFGLIFLLVPNKKICWRKKKNIISD